MDNKVKIKNLNKSFIRNNKALNVLDDITLSLTENQFVSIIGPSGCGKSTIFRILTGLEKEYTGNIKIDNKEISNSTLFSYMPQKDLLMPWRTVYENIILPIEIKSKTKKLTRIEKEKISNLIKEFGLKGFETFYPKELSGGMKQRAGLLRTFLMDSDILLLDEPFGALDAITRIKMQDWLLKIWQEHKKSVLFITHDIEEAIYLSDKVYVLSERPAKVILDIPITFDRPRNRDIIFTAKFNEYKQKISKSLLA